MKIYRLAFVSHKPLSGERGGAEIFNEEIVKNFKRYVNYVEHIEIPCSEATFDDILRGYITCYDLDLSRFDGVVSAKAPTYAVQHPNHVCYLVHTMRVFYDMFDEISADPSNYDKQKLIHHMDTELLKAPRVKKLFSIGHEVDKRLQEYNLLNSQVLHPGLISGNFMCNDYDYIYVPGRLHKWKRVELVVKAMKYVKSPIKLKIAGTGEQLKELQNLAGNDKRIEFLGYVTDQQMKELYADALCVTFTPIREDYGMILHEAFKSQKPVITCSDSGEPAYFIKDGQNGFVVEPEPSQIAERIDILYNNKELARHMGDCGKESIAHITWDNVVKTLLAALEA